MNAGSIRRLESLLALGVLSAGTLFAQTGLPRPDHVVIVMEENQDLASIVSPSSSIPYLQSLIDQGALFINSFALTHPSEPNYLALFSGSTQGVNDDSCPHHFSGQNLATELLAAGLTFAGYSEGLPRTGDTSCESGDYVRRHVPWVNFMNVPSALSLPFSKFPTNFHDLPTVCFVIPGLHNDMHSGTAPTADAWLRRHIGPYVQWAQTNNSLLLITWDEGRGADQIPTLFVGPMVRPGQYCEHITHYTVLRTLLDMYGLPALGGATHAEPITSAWTPESAPSPITVELTSPLDNTTLRAPARIDLAATASASNSAVVRVEFFQKSKKLGEATNNPFALAWTNVPKGTYYFAARATDDQGRTKWSTSVGVKVTAPVVLTSPLTITIQGNGRVTPAWNGQLLEIGRSYALTAIPSAGQLFAGWSGGTNGSAARLTFLMQSNLTLQANFVPNPFPPLHGSYAGLLYETNEVRTESAGYFTMTLSAGGAYSGSLRRGAVRQSISGHFDPAGHAVNRFISARTNVLNLELSVDLEDVLGRLRGRLGSGGWLAELQADRLVFNARTNPAPGTGRYTLDIPDDDSMPGSPAGDGIGFFTVSPAGSIHLAGTLADGSPVTQATSVSGRGQWPLYVSLYGGKGALVGWLNFTNAPLAGFSGNLSWIKPSLSGAKFYPGGFTNQNLALGSLYDPALSVTNGGMILGNAQIVFNEGNVAAPFTNFVYLSANRKVTNLSSNGLTLSFQAPTGRWSGTVTEPFGGQKLRITATLLQKQNIGVGFSLGTNQSGFVLLQATGIGD